MADTPKERDLRHQAEGALRALLGRIPSVRFKSFKAIDDVFGHQQPDWLTEITAGDQDWVLVIEGKRVGQPREIRSGVLQLKDFLHRAAGQPCYGVLVAPFISIESARICEEAGIGYLDLAGNTRLSFGHIYIETRSAENPYRERREVKSLFAPRACRVLRTLLQGPLHAWKVAALAKESQVSLGWVSTVRQQLLAREWAAAEADGVRISKPDAVLDAWRSADRWESRTNVRQYSLLLSEPHEIASSLQDFLGNAPHAFTQWFAGWLRQPYTVPPVVTVYVGEFPDELALKQRLLARRVDNGGRLWLAKPRDEGVFRPAQVVRGFTLVPDVQIYLDLQSAGQRGEEQAAELRKAPDFSGGWSA